MLIYISKYSHDHFQPDQPEEEDKNGEQSMWNPNELSFWEIRREGELLRAEDYKRKHQHNSSCGNCFAQINCQFCEVNMQNLSAKKRTSYIKEFAMRTTLMELGVRNNKSNLLC